MDPITRKETFLAKAGGQDVTTPTPVTREEYFLNEIANGGGGGGDNRFIVNLTPTAQDLSGTMDKTVAEIYEAYQSGKRIVFRVMTEDEHMEVDCTARWSHNGVTYPSFNGFAITNNGMIVHAFTGSSNNGEDMNYDTAIYPLTPVS